MLILDLPNQYDGYLILSESSLRLKDGILLIYQSLVSIGSLLLVIALALLTLFLLFAGIWRIVRLSSQIMYYVKKARK